MHSPSVLDFVILGADGVEYQHVQPHRVPKPFKAVKVKLGALEYHPFIAPREGVPIGYDCSVRGLSIDGVDTRYWRLCAIYPGKGLFTTLIAPDGQTKTMWESMRMASVAAG